MDPLGKSVGNENRSVRGDGHVPRSPERADGGARSADVPYPVPVLIEHLHAVVEYIDDAHIAVRRARESARQSELRGPAAALADRAQVFAGGGLEDFDPVRRQVGDPHLVADGQDAGGFERARFNRILNIHFAGRVGTRHAPAITDEAIAVRGNVDCKRVIPRRAEAIFGELARGRVPSKDDTERIIADQQLVSACGEIGGVHDRER